jgi:anti-sigma factor RsiW
MPRCVHQETLERFAYGKLPESEAATVETHLESCRRCAAALARLPVGQELLERVRELERSRDEIKDALSQLSETERRVSTTLFGETSR